jgi:hypothetical protein
MTDVATPEAAERRLLRHLVATLAYRSAKALRDVPDSFATYTLGDGRRTPLQIVAHMADLMEWGLRFAQGEYKWQAAGSDDWTRECRRYFDGLAALDARLADPAPLGYPADIIIQGPLADALTHTGQLSMMRGLAGHAVRPESYARAEIVIGRVSVEQAAPGREFDGDASAVKPAG